MPIGNPVTLTSNVASKTISSTATASQTLFNIQGGYRINAISVYRNGVKLVDGTDYSARDGASVTLLSAASEGDVLEFQIFDDFRVADGRSIEQCGLSNWTKENGYDCAATRRVASGKSKKHKDIVKVEKLESKPNRHSQKNHI